MFLCFRGKRYKAAQRRQHKRKRTRSLLSIYISINSVLLDKLAARTYIVAH